ncbi:C-GCAxxG-C-C family protein [Chloroflexota bacterium]
MTSEERTELLDRIEQEANDLEQTIHACARCALLSVARNLELGDEKCIEAILKASIPFAGGIAGTRAHCGGLTGGIMAIGLALVDYNPTEANPPRRTFVMKKAKEFHRRFEKELGYKSCYDIRETGMGRVYDSANPAEAQAFVDDGGYLLCGSVVGKAARLAAEAILDVWEEERKQI